MRIVQGEFRMKAIDYQKNNLVPPNHQTRFFRASALIADAYS